MMRILAIDYGERRIGLAVSDPLGMTAQPFETLIKDGGEIKIIAGIIKEKEVTRIIVGLPVNMNDTQSEMTKTVMAFAETLKTITTVPVEFVDERLTSIEANERARDMQLNPKKRKMVIDQIAAAIILEDYLRKAKT
ncbi:MAG: hypothetical protein A2252_08840 [Elusimicrobia bacterium RIFOXYA2_FULL_39_19]|nr:MAG: hypothetical protein A2252_08840 [Elusimicrobia bacterium RIFOXYA2_FULL_39_19]